MCWNEFVSMNTFIFGIFGLLIIAYNNKYSNYKISFFNNSYAYLFMLAFILMQLIEFILWRNLDNRVINNIVSILGSLVASEAIKLITNKYMPINQWFNWEDKDIESININNFDEITLLIVGAGAIGCELSKNLALIKNIKMNIIIIDFDIIEMSNLSRQFLFRDKHIGKLKCNILAEVINDINPNINIISLPLKVGVDNINFNEMKLTAVLMAVDNIDARKYMDSICLDLCIPMFDSGTEGMKGSTQPIIPFMLLM